MENRVTILGVDPGKTVGYAEITVNDHKVLDLCVFQERKEDWKIWDSQAMVRVKNADIIAIEDFTGAGPRTKESSFVLKQIGALELLGMINGCEVLVQTNKMRIKYVKFGADIYKEVFGRGICHHGKDAFAHALKALSRTHNVKELDFSGISR